MAEAERPAWCNLVGAIDAEEVKDGLISLGAIAAVYVLAITSANDSDFSL